MSQYAKIKLLLVDDHLVVRIGLRSLLESQADMLIVGEAASGAGAVKAFNELQPDVTLMDLRMPDLNGAEVTSAIRKKFPEAKILVLTTYDYDEDIYRALAAGAVGYLVKDTDSVPLLTTIRAIHSGRYRLPAPVAERINKRMAAPELSPRELEVLGFIVKGQSNKEIAATLGLAENTVKNHLKTIFEKLKVADRTQAATTALQRGIIKSINAS